MDITFRTQKLKGIFNSEKELKQAYGDRMARTIAMRLTVLKGASTLAAAASFSSLRLHQLRANRDAQYAVDLVHPHRLVFIPDYEPLPRKEDGGIDTGAVTAITIINVIDYHPGRKRK